MVLRKMANLPKRNIRKVLNRFQGRADDETTTSHPYLDAQSLLLAA